MFRILAAGLILLGLTLPALSQEAFGVLGDVLARKGLSVSDIMPDQINSEVDQTMADATMMIGCTTMMAILIVRGVADKQVADNMTIWTGALRRETLRRLDRIGLSPKKIDNLHDVMQTITIDTYRRTGGLPDAAACRTRAEGILAAEVQVEPPTAPPVPVEPQVADSPIKPAPVVPTLREFPVDLRDIALTRRNDGETCNFTVSRTTVTIGHKQQVAEGTFAVDQGYLVDFKGRWDTDKAATFDGFKLALTDDGRLLGNVTLFPLYSDTAEKPSFDKSFQPADAPRFSDGSAIGSAEFLVDRDKLRISFDVASCSKRPR